LNAAVCCLLTLSLGVVACGQDVAGFQSLTLSPVSSASSGHWARYRVDGAARDVDLYVAHSTDAKPVVLLIHGSGCAPLMTVDPGGGFHDTTLFQDLIPPHLEKLHFAVVDKRGVEPLRFSEGMTQKQKENAFELAQFRCSQDYLRNVTKQNRVDDVAAAIGALSRQPWVSRVILLGHSEGTHVATGVIRKMASGPITAAGLFASAGPIPYYGGYVARTAGDRDRFQSIFDQVRKLQQTDDDVMVEGHPARRFKTFWLDSTPIEDVRQSTVPLFVAQGTRDGSTLPADLFALEAIRQQPDRPLRYVVVDQGDHAFETPDGRSRIGELFDDFVRWALDPNRQTGLKVLK
jgi:pimeloyl-ACP methyl ester carboxylesterase